MSSGLLKTYHGDEDRPSFLLAPQLRSSSSVCPKCIALAIPVHSTVFQCAACGDYCDICRVFLEDGCLHFKKSPREMNPTQFKDYTRIFAEQQLAADLVTIQSTSSGKFLTLRDKFGALAFKSSASPSSRFLLHRRENNVVWLQAEDLSFVVLQDKEKFVTRFVGSYDLMISDARPGRNYLMDLDSYLFLQGDAKNVKASLHNNAESELKITKIGSIPRPPPGCSYEFGDILFIDQGQYQHYAMYTGWQYYHGNWTEVVAHYFNDAAGGIKWLQRKRGFAFVQYSSLQEFAQGKKIQIDKKTEKDSPDVILRRLQSKLGEESYSLVSNNCEHVTRFMSGGTSYSRQVLAKTNSKKLNSSKTLEKSRREALKPFLLRMKSQPDLYLSVRYYPQKGYSLELVPKSDSQTWIIRSDKRLENAFFNFVLESTGSEVTVVNPEDTFVTQGWTLQNGVICDLKNGITLEVEKGGCYARSGGSSTYWEATDQPENC